MIQNMRDLGGLRTGDGKKIRPGMLIRSAQLAQAGEGDLKHIAAVIDLRTPGERQEAPDLVYGRQYLTIPVFDDVQAGISREQGSEERGLPDMAFLYGRLVTDCADSFREILLAIMQHDFSAGAVLWHCSEGKDRCGITSALILELLGVDRGAILEDYLKTNLVNLPKAAAMRERMTETHGREFAENVYQAYIADERYLRAAWDAMGGDYIRGRLRIGSRAIDDFRNTVLED